MPVESNWGAVIADLASAGDRVDAGLSLAIEDRTAETFATIEDDWPSDTGESREAWSWEMTGELSSIIQNDVDYAIYVRNGDAAAQAEETFQTEMGDDFASELDALSAAIIDE